MNRKQQMLIVTAVREQRIVDIPGIIDGILETETKPHWRRDLNKLKVFIATGSPQFSVFMKKGNKKLPFLAFSTLPGQGFCPGAGDCLTFCYSYRAWRYPAAFCRQVQNSIMMQTAAGRVMLQMELDVYQSERVIDFRLYVDGDFRTIAEVVFWMNTLRERPWLRAYGYSKSWREFLTVASRGFEWPTNYMLNLSSGSKHAVSLKRAMQALPITRGEFIAVNVGHKVKSSDHGNREHQKALRAAYGSKAFTCPGQCGDCTPKGHACGSERFRDIPVIIAVH